MNLNNKNFDAVIIGGSYAGLSAALALGRALKHVLIIDAGNPCNKQTPHSHNFLTQDGKTPAQINAIALNDVLSYPNIKFESDIVVSISGTDNNFFVTTASGSSIAAKKLLFATGIKDVMPTIKGFAECWGISVIHCPYCHGYEYKGTNTGLLMTGDKAADHALFIKNWAGALTLLTNGGEELSAEKKRDLVAKGVNVVESQIQEVLHADGQLKSVVFTNGEQLELDALYAALPFTQHTNLPEVLGCNITPEGYIQADEFKRTSMPGVYAAGDNISPMRSVAMAVAAGMFAGVVISKDLINEMV